MCTQLILRSFFTALVSSLALAPLEAAHDSLNDCIDGWDYEPVTLTDEVLSLEEVETLALEDNKALQSLRFIAAQGEYRSFQVRSARWPQLNFSPSATWTETSAASFSDLYSSAISFSQTLVDRPLHHSIQLSEIENEELCTDFAILKNEVRFLVRTAYYNVVLQIGQTEVQKENVELLREALDLEERKLAVGETTRFDVNQSKVSFANALSDFFRSRRNLKLAKNDLLGLIGRDPNGHVQLKAQSMPVDSVPLLKKKIASLSSQQKALIELKEQDLQVRPLWESAGAPFSKEEIEEWEEMALCCQPEIHKCLLRLQGSHVLEARSRAEYLPKLSAFGSNSFSSGSPSRTSQLGLSVDWTIFDGWKREARIREQKLATCSAQIELERVIQNTRLELRNRFDEIEEAVLSYYAAKQSVEVAEQALELARARRELGVITPIEYREVTASLTEARQTLNSASFALLRSYYALRKQAGADVRESCCEAQ